ncbi:MAG: hypothetical protein RMK18_04955 [Armatimonadota bacterium]|nr:hypothetical protein [Armatimonadota bacterium]MCX7777152.1 hypothetical protein [Armatimonadota bacterium]MDW8025200.1 hypothetical protein [Armatimonadota bacterium]
MYRITLIATLAVTFFMHLLDRVATQPPAQELKPPVGKSYNDIRSEIDVLVFIKRWGFDKEQLKLAHKLVMKLYEAENEIEKARNSPELLALLWQARMAMLRGEDATPWLEKVDELEGNLTSKLEEAFWELHEQVLNELRKALSNEQASKMAIDETVWGRLVEVANEFAEMVKADEDEWVNWRTSVANELRDAAREHNPNAPKDIADQITIMLIKFKQLAVEQPKQAKADLHKRLLSLVLPEEKRTGPTKEEAEERIREILRAGFLSNLKATVSILNDLLGIKP